MKTGFNYGLLFTAGAMVFLAITEKVLFWFSDRSEAKQGVKEIDVTERIARVEAAVRKANEEMASLRSELMAGR